MTNILTLNNVSKTYKLGQPNQITVLDQVNLNVEKGEVVGLIAPSGAGKSTLLHMIENVQKQEGKILASFTNFIIYCQSSMQLKI